MLLIKPENFCHKILTIKLIPRRSLLKELYEYMFILFLSLMFVLITVIVQWLQNIMILNYAQIYLMSSKWTKTFAHTLL